MKIYWFLGHEQFQPEVLVKHARAAEAAGFDGVMVSEHFHPWVDDVGTGGFAFATLGALAAATEHLELMTAVTTPLWRYHPAIVAQAAATIDRLSGGRFALGVGTGENINEGALGYTFPAYAERAARMREALGLMRRLLDGERVDFAGQYYQTKAAKLYSPPTQRLPIYLAADGPKSATLAGETADGVVTSVKDLDATRAKVLEPITAAAQGAGRPRSAVVATHWAVRAHDDDEAWQALAAWRGLRAPSRLTATDPAVLRAEADGLPRAEVLGRYPQVWSAEDYVAEFTPVVRELQPDILGIQTTGLDHLAALELVGREVAPELRKLGTKERQ